MIRLSCLFVIALLLTPIALFVVATLLVFKTSPGACGSGRPLQADTALSAAYDARWRAFNSQLLSGQPASLTVSDSEATSRARQFLVQTGAPVRDLRLCFVPGGGDVNATLDTPFGADVDVRVKGRVDVSGRHPKTQIDAIEIGGMPSFVTRPFRGLVTRIIDDQTNQIELDHRLSVDVRDGQAVISGTP